MYILSEYELNCNGKLQATNATTEKDTAALEQHIHELETILANQQQQLKTLQQNLHREQVQLQNRKEYDTLSQVILQYENRATQTQRYEQMKQQLEDLNRENNRLIQLIELRHKQFALLMHTIDELQVTLDDDPTRFHVPVPVSKQATYQPVLIEKSSPITSVQATPSTPMVESSLSSTHAVDANSSSSSSIATPTPLSSLDSSSTTPLSSDSTTSDTLSVTTSNGESSFTSHHDDTETKTDESDGRMDIDLN